MVAWRGCRDTSRSRLRPLRRLRCPRFFHCCRYSDAPPDPHLLRGSDAVHRRHSAPRRATGHRIRRWVFPEGARAGDHESAQLGPRGATHRVQAPSGYRSGSHGEHDNRPWRAVLRGATEPMVAAPRERVGDIPGLSAQAGFLSSELPVHRWSKTGLRSARRASRWAAQDEPHRSLVLRGALQNLPDPSAGRRQEYPCSPVCPPSGGDLSLNSKCTRRGSGLQIGNSLARTPLGSYRSCRFRDVRRGREWVQGVGRYGRYCIDGSGRGLLDDRSPGPSLGHALAQDGADELRLGWVPGIDRCSCDLLSPSQPRARTGVDAGLRCHPGAQLGLARRM